MLLGYKPVQHVTVLNTVGNCNTMVSIITLYYNVIISSDHPTICGLLLTVMSLCSAWLYVTQWTEIDIQFAVLYRPNSTQLHNTALYTYSSCLCFHPSNHNHDIKGAFMCNSVPVSLCALFNPLQHSIRYCDATKQTASQPARH